MRVSSLCALSEDSHRTLCRFASRYNVDPPDYFVRTKILEFAIHKLLGGHEYINAGDSLEATNDRSLACLSVRFPLEFDFSDPKARSLVRKQIERHMRLCTIATSGFDVLFSTVGSEPLLAEAAAWAMDNENTNPVRLLSNLMGKNCINHGERGELAAALLVMQACDAARTRGENSRWVYVCDFLESLLGGPTRTDDAFPSVMLPMEERQSLAETFKGARMWFNHVVKVRDTNLINVRYLWRFISRGAMVLCANNQPGVEIVLPVCYKGNELSRRNVTAILIQVKNDMRFGERIHGYLFDAMDPFTIKLFDEESRPIQQEKPEDNSQPLGPLPIIRMVFALGSESHAVKYDGSGRRTPQTGEFTSYDIWCAGTLSKTFPIMGDDQQAYIELVDRTRFRDQEYAMGKIQNLTYPEEVEAKKVALLRNCNPLLETGAEHQLFCEEDPTEERGPRGSSPKKGPSVSKCHQVP